MGTTTMERVKRVKCAARDGFKVMENFLKENKITNNANAMNRVFASFVIACSVMFLVSGDRNDNGHQKKTNGFGLTDERFGENFPGARTVEEGYAYVQPPSPPSPAHPAIAKISTISTHAWSRKQYEIAKEANDHAALRAISGQIFGGLDSEIPFEEKPPISNKVSSASFSPCAALYQSVASSSSSYQCAERAGLPSCVRHSDALPFKGDWMSLHVDGRKGTDGDFARRANALSGLFGPNGNFPAIKTEVDELYGGFPKGDWLNNTRSSPRKFALVHTCALVHSDGKLKGSGLGHRIDKHHIVVRLNDAPVLGHEDDVGSFTSSRFLGEKYFRKSTRTGDNLERATREFPDESLVALQWCGVKQEALHGKANHESVCRKDAVLRAAKMKAHLFNPKFIDAVSRSLELKDDEAPSDFFVALIALTHVCSKVDVYGFNLYDKRDLVKSKHSSYLGEENGKYHLPRRYGNVANEKTGVMKKPDFEKSPQGYTFAKFNRIAPDQVTVEAGGIHKPGLIGSSAHTFGGYALGTYKDKTKLHGLRKLLSKAHLPREKPEVVRDKESFCVRALHHMGIVSNVEASGVEGSPSNVKYEWTRSRKQMPTHALNKKG